MSNSGQRFEVECFILLFQSESYSESSHWTLQSNGDTFRFWRKMLCSLRDLTECEQQRGFCGRINPTLKEQVIILGNMLIFLLSWKCHVCLVIKNLQWEDRSTSSYLKWIGRLLVNPKKNKVVDDCFRNSMTIALSAVLDSHDTVAVWLCYGKKFNWLGQGTETTRYMLRKSVCGLYVNSR